MVEEIYSIIYLLLIIMLLIAGSGEPGLEGQGVSELHARDRYDIADQIIAFHSLAHL